MIFKNVCAIRTYISAEYHQHLQNLSCSFEDMHRYHIRLLNELSKRSLHFANF